MTLDNPTNPKQEIAILARHVADKVIEHLRVKQPAEQEYLDTKQAADYLGLSKQRLEIWRVTNGGPKFVKLDQAVRYSRAALDGFMIAHTRNHTADGGCHA